MNVLLVLFVASTPILSWVKHIDVTYPTMYEYPVIRSEVNFGSEPLSFSAIEISLSLLCGVSGSSSQDPPWTSPFSSLGNWGAPWSGEVGGTVSPGKQRHWQLKVFNNGGEEGWAQNGVEHVRVRIVRSTQGEILWYEESASGGGS